MLDWISSHPWLSAWLAWPLALVLAAFAWSVATALSNVISVFLNWLYLMSCIIVTLFRGYPPDRKSEDSDDKNDPENKEHRPLAS